MFVNRYETARKPQGTAVHVMAVYNGDAYCYPLCDGDGIWFAHVNRVPGPVTCKGCIRKLQQARDSANALLGEEE
jgi:hypothetical protein